MLVRCINCGFSCQNYGKTKAGSQRWHCKQCNITFTQTIDNTTKCFHRFLNWLFSKETQQDMPGHLVKKHNRICLGRAVHFVDR